MNKELIQMALDSLISRCGINADEWKVLIPALRAELERPSNEIEPSANDLTSYLACTIECELFETKVLPAIHEFYWRIQA